MQNLYNRMIAFRSTVGVHLLRNFGQGVHARQFLVHVSLSEIQVRLATMRISKESISKNLIGNWFHVEIHILGTEICKQLLQV